MPLFKKKQPTQKTSDRQSNESQVSPAFAQLERQYRRDVFIVRHTRTIVYIAIGAGAVLLAALLAWFLYVVFQPSPDCRVDADCTAGYRCRLERCVINTGVLPPTDLSISMGVPVLIKGSGSKYDVVVSVTNPSKEWATADFSYSITLLGSAGQEVASVSSSAFLLPRETRYLVHVGVLADSPATSATISVNEPEWQRTGDIDEPGFQTHDVSYFPVTVGSGKSKVSAFLTNRSSFDYDTVYVNVLLLDKDGATVGVNTTTLNTFLSQQERQFEVMWPTLYEGVAEVVIQAEVNVLDPSVLLNQFDNTIEPFQQRDMLEQTK